MAGGPLPNEFEEFLRYLSKNLRRAPGTIRCRRAALASLARYLDSIDVEPREASERDLLAWQEQLGMADGTVQNYTVAVRMVYKWMASRRSGRLLDEDPADELPGIRVVPTPGQPISGEDLELALLSAEHVPHLRTWMLLEASTGIRPCQIASLTKHRVRYTGGRVVLTVTGKGRTMSVVGGPVVARDLRQWTSGAQGPLWFNQHGSPVRAANITDQVNRHLSSLGIDVTSHGLRRWFAENAYRISGKNIRTVQELLGHASPVTTALYIPPEETGAADVADGVSQLLPLRRAQ